MVGGCGVCKGYTESLGVLLPHCQLLLGEEEVVGDEAPSDLCERAMREEGRLDVVRLQTLWLAVCSEVWGDTTPD